MTVLGISGSPRRQGNTEMLLDRVLEGAQSRGAPTQKLVLHGLDIRPCTGCGRCKKSGQCWQQDDMQGIYGDLLTARHVVIASPVYFMAVSGQVKLMMDRCQCLWEARYTIERDFPESPPDRKGAFLSVGGTGYKFLFDGPRRSVKAFFNTIGVAYWDELVFREVDGKGAIREVEGALEDAFDMGARLVTAPPSA